MDITVNDIVEESNIKAAMEYLSTKRDSCGIDGMKLSDLPGYWEANGAKIVDSILDGTYAMGLIKQCEIVNYKGKHRIISLMNSADRLVYRAAYQVLSPYFDTLFSCHSYAYRENKGVTEAIKQATEYMENGYTWSVELDIHSFFDNINQDFLL